MIKDLVVRNEDREILWRSLRDRQNQAGFYHQQGDIPFQLDAGLLSLFTGAAGSGDESESLIDF